MLDKNTKLNLCSTLGRGGFLRDFLLPRGFGGDETVSPPVAARGGFSLRTPEVRLASGTVPGDHLYF